MYTERNFNDDLFNISKSHFIKLKLLQDFANKKISQQDFADQISIRKSKEEVNQVLKEVSDLQQKKSDGKFDEDVVLAARNLRKAGKFQEAFNKISPYIQQCKTDESANLTFGWIMYDYLKASEQNLEEYTSNLKKMNDFVQFDFKINNSKYLTTLLNAFLWSIGRVVDIELAANRIFEQFKRFIGNSSEFIEKRVLNLSAHNNDASPSRILIKKLCIELNDSNYFEFIDIIGFDWFDDYDYATSSFTNENGETKNVHPLAERMLGYHAKKLLESDEYLATRERIIAFLSQLTSTIKSHPEYEWLPYYRIKLLIKLGDKEQAFSEATQFARNKSRDFWVWQLISELVDGDERFNCLCAGLLCKTKPEMIVSLQKYSIPYLIEREMYEEAKYLLDMVIETLTRKNWKISYDLLDMQSKSWYRNSKVVKSISSLQPFADKAKKILYQNLPFRDVFVTYINNENGVINFAFIDRKIIKKGYFYKDSIDTNFNWQVNSSVKLQMTEDKKHTSLYRVYAVVKGDEKFEGYFIKKFSGTFEKVREFGFIRDSIGDIFVNPVMIKKNKLQPFSKIYGTTVRKWNTKNNRWGWEVLTIDRVEDQNLSGLDKEISEVIKITEKG